MYSPTLGRWVQNDPITFEAGDENLYRFVGNDPTNATDPSGLQLTVTDKAKLSPSYNPFIGVPNLIGPEYSVWDSKIYSRGWYGAAYHKKPQHETALIRVSLEATGIKDGKVHLGLVYQVLESPASFVGVRPNSHELTELMSNVPNHKLTTVPIGGRKIGAGLAWVGTASGVWQSIIDLGEVPCGDQKYSGIIGVFPKSREDRKTENAVQLIRWEIQMSAAGVVAGKVTLEETGFGRTPEIPGKDALKLWRTEVWGGIGDAPTPGSRFPLDIKTPAFPQGAWDLDEDILKPPGK